MMEDKDKIILTPEEMLGVAFRLVRMYVLALVGLNLSILAAITICLYVDYDDYLDLKAIIPDIIMPLKVTLIMFAVLSLTPWVFYCVVSNCFDQLGFLQCIYSIASVSMWAFSCIGLNIIYYD